MESLPLFDILVVSCGLIITAWFVLFTNTSSKATRRERVRRMVDRMEARGRNVYADYVGEVEAYGTEKNVNQHRVPL